MLLSCHVSRETLLLGKPPKSGSARLGHIPSLPRESQLPLKPCISLHPSDFEGNCDSSDFLLDFCCSFILQLDLLRKCGLLAHASAAFLKNCCIEKLLFCLWLEYCNPISMLLSCHVSRETLLLGKPPKSGSARLGHIPSLPRESQLPLKPCISLHPSDFEGNCDSLRFSPRFLLQFHSTVRFASQMWATRPHLGSIFEKLLHRKTFCLPAARILQSNFYFAFMSCNVMFHVKQCYCTACSTANNSRHAPLSQL